MTNHKKKKNDNREYEIGYCKPPKEHQFKKGRSGNPGGRPKGAKNKPKKTPESYFSELFAAEANRLVNITENGKTVNTEMISAVFRSIFAKAANGDIKAQTLTLEYVDKCDQKRRKEEEGLVLSAMGYKERWSNEFAERERTGRTGPTPIPHPDDVVINLRTGKVEFNGPVTPGELAAIELSQTALKENRALLDENLKELGTTHDPEDHQRILKSSELAQKNIDRILEAVPKKWTRYR